jgi:polysaccharide export outer membrane protein
MPKILDVWPVRIKKVMKNSLLILVVTAVLLAVSFATSSFAMGAQDDSGIKSSYILGPNDQITVHALDAEEISDKPYRISAAGDVTFPMIGKVKAAGLTVEELESSLVQALQEFIRQPKVAVTVTEFHSQPVSVMGAVTNPGVLQLQGNKNIIEVLSMVGGVRNDAGSSITITRKREWGVLPLPNAKLDPTGQFSTGEIKLKDVLGARNPEQNILIRPNDVISVTRNEIVYVLGAVKKAGGFPMNEHDTLSVLQILSLAEGLERTAAPQQAKILRVTPGATRRTEMLVNLDQIFSGKAEDVQLEQDDILFVPDSREKRAVLRTLEALVSMGTTVGAYAIIYR